MEEGQGQDNKADQIQASAAEAVMTSEHAAVDAAAPADAEDPTSELVPADQVPNCSTFGRRTWYYEIFVGGLARETKECDLEAVFGAVGEGGGGWGADRMRG